MYATNIKPNWCSSVNLSSYKLTLYIVKPSLWNTPNELANDAAAIARRDAMIIAETGASTVFNIDNVNLITFIRGGQANADAKAGVVQFQMQEVLGFNFLDKILAISTEFGFPTIASANYVMKIEFVGKDPDTDMRTTYPNIFLYSLTFSEIQASVDQSGTTYDIIALNNSRTAKYNSSVYTPVTVTGFNTLNEFISEVQKACNKYEADIISTEQDGGPQPRKHWEIRLDSTLTNASAPAGPDPVEAAGYGAGQVDPSLAKFLPKPKSVNLSNAPMMGMGDSGSATKQTAETDGTRTITINRNTNISDWLEQTITRQLPAFTEYSKAEKKKVGSVPIIKASTNVEQSEKIDPRTNTPELKIIITVGVYNDSAQAPTDLQRHEAHITKKKNQQEYVTSIGTQIVKKYNWLYTGQNTEVMGFDLNVNNAFFIAQDPNQGNNYPEASQMKTPSQPVRATTISPGQQAFLSQVEVQRIPIERSQGMVQPASSKSQSTNEESGQNMDTMHDRQMARREQDFLNMTLEVKGDPFWLGAGVSIEGRDISLGDVSNGTVYLAFLTYKPEETVTYTEGQRRGDMDTAASGLYEVFKVEHTLASGQYKSTLHCIRNRNFSTYLMQQELEQM